MCTVCFKIDKNVRWSKDSISDALKVIGRLVSTHQLVEVGKVDPGGPFLVIRYKCQECSAIWRLTYPDHAIKGGFAREL